MPVRDDGVMSRIDEEYTAQPILGSRRVTAWLKRAGEAVNRKTA